MNKLRLLAAGWLCCLPAIAQRPEFVRVPPGGIEIGCTKEQRCAEPTPVRRVDFNRPFWIGKTEVTVEHFRAFVTATGYRTDAEKAGNVRTWRAPGFRLSGRQPVVYVSPTDAAAYCAWIGGRLPSEEEWEYAARAGASTLHFWGDSLNDRYVWHRENSGGAPRPAGCKPANAFGLHDVEGNAWEWVRGFDINTGKILPVMRGGSWMSCASISPWKPPGTQRLMRVVARRIPDKRDDDIGFRCVRESSAEPQLR